MLVNNSMVLDVHLYLKLALLVLINTCEQFWDMGEEAGGSKRPACLSFKGAWERQKCPI